MPRTKIDYLIGLYRELEERYSLRLWDEVCIAETAYKMKLGNMVLWKALEKAGYKHFIGSIARIDGEEGDCIYSIYSMGAGMLDAFGLLCREAGILIKRIEIEYLSYEGKECISKLSLTEEESEKLEPYIDELCMMDLEYATVTVLKWQDFYRKLDGIKEERRQFIEEAIEDSLCFSPFYVNYYRSLPERNSFRLENDLYIFFASGTVASTGEFVDACHVSPVKVLLLLVVHEILKGKSCQGCLALGS